MAIAGAACQAGNHAPPPAAGSPAASTANAIAGLGRIQPGDGIVRIGARGLSGQASIVKQLLVHEGDTVRAGQPVAELDSHDQLSALDAQAKSRVEVARRRLAQVQSGAQPSEVAAVQAEIDSLEAQHAHAQRDLERYRLLGDNVTASEIDRLAVAVDVSAKSLAGARERLATVRTVRPVDVELARAELEDAIRSEAAARAQQIASTVRSPIDGRVIRIYAWPGEDVRDQGVMEVAPREPMFVVAEIAESDIGRVTVGQHAKITGAGLPAPISGTVERIGLKVLENRVLPADPASFSDARVVNTWIRIADSNAVADRINLRVDVVIEP
jgi:HlyD family secretion protein